MKKLTKILSMALSIALIGATLVMPTTANAATSLYENKFNTDDSVKALVDAGATRDNSVKEFNVNGRMDNVAKIYKGNNAGIGAWGTAWEHDVVTVEFMIYDPNGNGFNMYPSAATTLAFTTDNRVGIEIDSSGNIGFKIRGTTEDSGADCTLNVWNKFAYTVDIPNDTLKIYLNGALVATKTSVGLAEGGYHSDLRFGTGQTNPTYLDELRAYTGEYDPSQDIAPANVTPAGLVGGGFLATGNVSDVKAALMAGQDAGKVKAEIYTDYIGGTVATELRAGYIAVVSSLSGDIAKCYPVIAPVVVDSVVFSGGTVTGAVQNYSASAIPSMTMILVEDGGKVVYSSATQTNITATATFTISGLGGTLSNAEVFFVNDWSNPQAVLDSLYDVN